MANHAIVIGINTYANPAWNLDAAAADAVRFAKWAMANADVPPSNLDLLLSVAPGANIDLPYRDATRHTIGLALDAFITGSKKKRTKERLFFYYAGHGVSAAGVAARGIQEPVLIPADVSALESEAYLLLGFSEIMPMLVTSGPREQFFFIDACRDFRLGRNFTAGIAGYSGRWVGPSSSPGTRNAQYVMYATAPGLPAYERRLLGRGVFGGALLDGLGGNGSAVRWANGQYEVRFNTLMGHVRNVVARSLEGVQNADARRAIQLPEPETRSGDPDPLLAFFPTRPKVQVRVRVAPSVALRTCTVEAGYALPGGEYKSATSKGPPTTGTSTLELSPGDYVLRAVATDYSEVRSPYSIYEPLTVPFALKLAPAAPRARGRAPALGVDRAAMAAAPAIAPPAGAAGQPLTGMLHVSSEDPSVPVLVWDSTGTVVDTKLGSVDKEVPAGIYRVQLVLPEGPAADQTIEVQAGLPTTVALACPPPPISKPQRDMLAALDITTDAEGYLGASEYLPKLASPPLASVLSFAAFAAHWPFAAAFQRLRAMGVMSLRGAVQPGQSGVIVVVGASGEAPVQGVDRETFLNGGELVIRDAAGKPVLQDRLSRLSGFAAATQNGVQTPPGPLVVELRLPGLDPTRYALTGLKDRVSLLVIVATDGGRFDVQQYSLPLRDVTIPGPNGQVIQEYLAMDPTHIRGIELAQRYFLSDQNIPHSADLHVLLDGKWFDPLLACIAGYSLVRQGLTDQFLVAMRNMLTYFGDLPDSHVLAGLCEPRKRATHFRNALKAGLPTFAEGLRALHDWGKERRDLPPTLADAARRLIPGSPWTVWVAGRPAILVKHGSFATVPVGWQVLETHRATVEASLGSVGRISTSAPNGSGGIGCGFVVASDVVMTAAHVATAFAEPRGRRWAMRSGVTATIDFDVETGRKRSPAGDFKITGILAFDKGKDFALLEIEPRKGFRGPHPPPLVLSREPSGPIEGHEVYVVGHPHGEATPTANIDPELVARVFGRQSGVKRIQPGIILGLVDRVSARGVKMSAAAISHDCFTLAGDGGAPVIDLATGRVLGVHLGAAPRGDYKQGFALRLWSVQTNAKIESAGLEFV